MHDIKVKAVKIAMILIIVCIGVVLNVYVRISCSLRGARDRDGDDIFDTTVSSYQTDCLFYLHQDGQLSKLLCCPSRDAADH